MRGGGDCGTVTILCPFVWGEQRRSPCGAGVPHASTKTSRTRHRTPPATCAFTSGNGGRPRGQPAAGVLGRPSQAGSAGGFAGFPSMISLRCVL